MTCEIKRPRELKRSGLIEVLEIAEDGHRTETKHRDMYSHTGVLVQTDV